jgi:hypothetical protein
MATLTVRDIAVHIQRAGEPLTAAIDRLRNWTKMGLIKPSGEQNPGTGRKKHYTTVALLEAVLLQALTDTLGSSAVSLSPLVAQISKMVRRGVIVGFPARHLAELLVLSKPPGADALSISVVEPKNLRRHISESGRTIHMVINISRIFKRLPYEWQDVFPETIDAMRKLQKASNAKRTKSAK